MTSITVSDESAWHALRKTHVGASEIAALFNLSPWVTKWQLYQIKRGALPGVVETTAMTQGKHFEPAVASYAQEKFGIQLRKVRRYLECDTCPGLGASLDYEEYGSGELIPTELKFSLWGDGWAWEGDELTEVPDHYMLQLQTQIVCAGSDRAQIIPFTGGDLKRMVVPRSEPIITRIIEETNQFWDDVKNEREPPVDFSADAEAINRLANLTPLRNVTFPPDMEPLFQEYVVAKAVWDESEDRCDAIKAELTKYILDAGHGNADSVKAECGGHQFSLSKVAESKGKLITAADVGNYVGSRKPHNRVTIGLKKEKKS